MKIVVATCTSLLFIHTLLGVEATLVEYRQYELLKSAKSAVFVLQKFYKVLL